MTQVSVLSLLQFISTYSKYRPCIVYPFQNSFFQILFFRFNHDFVFFFLIEFVKFNLYHEMDEMLYAYTYCMFLDPLKHNRINLVN